MRYYRLFLISAILLSACSTLQHVENLPEKAESAYLSGNMEEAQRVYEELIAQSESGMEMAEGVYYKRAGLAAYSLGDNRKALQHLERLRHTEVGNEQTHYILAILYREIDNLSREITHLTEYAQHYPKGDEIEYVQIRLFETLVESRNYLEAYEMWNSLPQGKTEDESLMVQWFYLHQALEKTDALPDLAEDLLNINPLNREAMDYLARKHFRDAESLYNREMQAYEANRTNRQYARLLEALEIVNTNLHIALNYFTRLYDQTGAPQYAGFLASIYERFQDDEKAAYFRGKSRQ